MAVPDFQSLMLPVLQAASEGDKAAADIRRLVANAFQLSPDDLAERQESGTQTKFGNRTAWAIFYLDRAGLLDRVKRGVYRASADGRKVLAERPSKIDLKFLTRFPRYVEWRSGPHASHQTEAKVDDAKVASSEIELTTPEDQIENSYRGCLRRS